MKYYYLIPLLLSTSLSSCRVGPVYTPPCSVVPTEWKNTDVVSEDYAITLDKWWEIFDDPLLSALEDEAMANSPTLDTAIAKVIEARALAGVEAASLYPQITLDPSSYNSGMLYRIFLPQALANIPGFPKSIPPFRVHQRQYMMPFNFNYELDLWGQLQDRLESAIYSAEAQAQAYNETLLTLTTDVATNYFQVRTLDAQIVLLENTIKARYSNYELTLSRFRKGLVNFLDVTQAEIDLATAKASLEDSKRMRVLAEDQIATLTGKFASQFELAPMPLTDPPPPIPAGLPADLLLKRPDIAEAERNMASEHALISAAYASFFPSINLTAALGFSSPDLKHFLKWISRYWAYGVNMSQMVFDGGRDCANLEAAVARFKEASGNYQQTVFVAFQEVEDALNNIEQYTKQANHLKEAVDAAQKATTLSKNRYVNGVTIYLEVVENERLALQAEINWMATLNLRYSATVQLIKAVGGSISLPSINNLCQK